MKQLVKKRTVKRQYSLPRWSSYVIGVLVLLLVALFVWQYSPALTGNATVDTTAYSSLQKTDIGEVLLPNTPLYYMEREEYSSGVPTGNIISEYIQQSSPAVFETIKGVKKYGLIGYFLPPTLGVPPGRYKEVPLPVKGIVPISAVYGQKYKDESILSSSPYGQLYDQNGQAEATLRERGVYEVPQPAYLKYYLAAGNIVGYATTQPTKILPLTSEATPPAVQKPVKNYGSLEVYVSGYDSAKGRYDLWVVYNDGNILMKDIQFSLRYHKNMADATVYNSADSRYGFTVSATETMKPEDSLLFPGEEVRTTYSTKGVFGSSTYAVRVCDSSSKLSCELDHETARQARAVMLMAAKNSEVQKSLTNDPGDDNYDILAVKHGYVLSDVTGVTPEGVRVPITVKRTSMRDS